MSFRTITGLSKNAIAIFEMVCAASKLSGMVLYVAWWRLEDPEADI